MKAVPRERVSENVRAYITASGEEQRASPSLTPKDAPAGLVAILTIGNRVFYIRSGAVLSTDNREDAVNALMLEFLQGR